MTRTIGQVPPAERPLVSAPMDVNAARFLVILVSLLLLASWLFFKAFIVASGLVGLVAAVFIRRWHTRHPSTLPYTPRTNAPEINLSRIPVGGDVAGLMFAAGSVAVVIIGVPDMAWYFVSALLCAVLLAWAIFAYRSAHGRVAGDRPLGLS